MIVIVLALATDKVVFPAAVVVVDAVTADAAGVVGVAAVVAVAAFAAAAAAAAASTAGPIFIAVLDLRILVEFLVEASGGSRLREAGRRKSRRRRRRGGERRRRKIVLRVDTSKYMIVFVPCA